MSAVDIFLLLLLAVAAAGHFAWFVSVAVGERSAEQAVLLRGCVLADVACLVVGLVAGVWWLLLFGLPLLLIGAWGLSSYQAEKQRNEAAVAAAKLEESLTDGDREWVQLHTRLGQELDYDRWLPVGPSTETRGGVSIPG